LSISVCLAAYNGARFIREQVDSILPQLRPDDEIVVVDDCSRDNTVEILERYADPRMTIHRNQRNGGHVYSFGRALSLATRDVVFMADQDDRWADGRVAAMLETLNEAKVLLVSGNTSYMDAEGRPIEYSATRLRKADSRRHFMNVVGMFTGRTGYYGCAMAMRRELLDLVLPIPAFVESHDLWISMGANLLRSNAHLEGDTLARRVHGENASILRRDLYMRLRARWIFCRSIAVLMARARRIRNLHPIGHR